MQAFIMLTYLEFFQTSENQPNWKCLSAKCKFPIRQYGWLDQHNNCAVSVVLPIYMRTGFQRDFCGETQYTGSSIEEKSRLIICHFSTKVGKPETGVGWSPNIGDGFRRDNSGQGQTQILLFVICISREV